MPIAISDSLIHHAGSPTPPVWSLSAFDANSLNDTIAFTAMHAPSVSTLRSIGEAAHPLPQSPQNDVAIISLLLIAAYTFVYCLCNSKEYFINQLKDFFNIRQRKNLFAEHAETELRGRWLLILLTCTLMGLCLFIDLQHDNLSHHINLHLLSALCVGYCLGGYLLKWGITYGVNQTFFDNNATNVWNESYQLLTFLIGLIMLPITILFTFNECGHETLHTLLVIVLLLAEILLSYKTFRTFFNGVMGFIHLILYLCALELLPLLFLWHGWNLLSKNLTIHFN